MQIQVTPWYLINCMMMIPWEFCEAQDKAASHPRARVLLVGCGGVIQQVEVEDIDKSSKVCPIEALHCG